MNEEVEDMVVLRAEGDALIRKMQEEVENMFEATTMQRNVRV